MNEQERIERDGLTEPPIKFYGKNCEHNYFSNFAPLGLWLPHPFTGELTWYPTGEHAYQARKAWTDEEHDHVLAASTPFESKKRGQAVALRDGWDTGARRTLYPLCYYVMLEVVWGKVMEHEHIAYALLESDERAIWEDSPTDDIWGIRYRNDYRGRNLLGRSWMETREKLFGAFGQVTEVMLQRG